MLLRRETLDRIVRSEIVLAFRRWRRPTVRAGGTLLTAAGQLRIGEVSIVDPETISPEDAARAGYPSREALLDELASRTDGDVYRIEFLGVGPDPRVALRQAPLDADHVEQVRSRLAKLDDASPDGAWTERALEVIRDNPGLGSDHLCRLVGQERRRFKGNVRKLKALGLTISLDVGYRLSARGEEYLRKRTS
jgi:hypothetical protein